MQRAARPKADADGAAIAALICAFIIPVLGIIFGHVSRGQARRKGLEPSGVATAGCVLGYVFTAIAVIAIIAIAVAAAYAGSAPCDTGNPNWPYC
jgi:peptidyl-prolyl cis-trans isomerase B (cyclophilin B)